MADDIDSDFFVVDEVDLFLEELNEDLSSSDDDIELAVELITGEIDPDDVKLPEEESKTVMETVTLKEESCTEISKNRNRYIEPKTVNIVMLWGKKYRKVQGSPVYSLIE